jgi:hypothetical protein
MTARTSPSSDTLPRELLRRSRLALARLGEARWAGPGAPAPPDAARRALFRCLLALRGVPPAGLPAGCAALARDDDAALATLMGPPGDPVRALLVALPADALGQLYEALADATPRRAAGAWYTPPAVVEDLVARGLAGLRPADAPRAWADVRVLDPAVGSGRFLVAAARALALRQGSAAAPGCPLLRAVVERQLVGVDADPLALELARLQLGELLAGRAGPLPCPAPPRSGVRHTVPLAQLVPGDALQLLPRGAGGLGRGFDLVVGNPPYGVVPPSADRAALRALYPLHRGAFDRYRLFLAAALSALVPGGRAALLLPTTWLTLRHAAPLRAHLLAGFNVRELTRLDADLFPDAHVDVAAVVIERSPPDAQPLVLRRAASPAALEADNVRLSQVPAGDLLAARRALLAPAARATAAPADSPAPDAGLADLAARLAAAHPPAGALARFVCGLKPYQRGKGTPPQSGAEARARRFETDGPTDPSCRPLLAGRHVRPFALAWEPDSWLRYGPWLAEPRAPAVFAAPLKLVGRQTGNRLVVAPDDAQRVARDSTWLVLAPPAAPPAAARRLLLWLLAVLNDPVATFLFRARDPDEVDKTFPQVRVGSLARLPAPDPAAADPALVEEILALVTERAALGAAPPPDHATVLESALAERLARAWGLSAAESAAVRAALGPAPAPAPTPPAAPAGVPRGAPLAAAGPLR